MIQTVLAYVIVAVAAAWSLRSFLPRLKPTQVKAAPKSDGACENCDCGR
ncbi:MAG TPA: hypothetical protein VGI79_23055 [Caulobacteraceae bacterium]|jgi:uncharacterized membrane protein YuzA (DUF378 family)